MSFKILNSKNSKFVPKLKKFLNIEIFGRREKELLEKVNSNKIISIKLVNNKNKKIDSIKEKLSNYALKAITSFDFITTKTESISHKKIKEKRDAFLTENKSGKIKFPHYQTLTEFNVNKKMERFKNNKFFSANNIKKHNTKVLNKYNNNSDKSFNTINNINQNNNIICIKEKDSKIDLLKELEKENTKNEIKVNKKYMYILNTKHKKLNLKKIGVNNMLVQTRNLMLNKFTQDIKKEINMNIQESYENKLESIIDKINSIKIGINLYDIKFANKLNEFIKYILYYRDNEKKKCDLLENNKNKIKKEIILLQNKLKKAQLERDNILRWVYFQIKMKEKKLILPHYYKLIFESNLNRNIMRRKTISSGLMSLKNLWDAQTPHHLQKHKLTEIHEEDSSKNLDFSNLKTIKSDEKYSNHNKYKYQSQRNSILTKSKKSSDHLTSVKLINFGDITINKTLQNINKNMDKDEIDGYEMNRINQYKHFLIYETPGDFQERLNEFENDNILLIERYNSLQRQLNKLKITYNKLLSEKTENEIYIINKIKLKEYELKEIIKINELLNNQISDMKKGKFYIHNSNPLLNKLKNNYTFHNKHISHNPLGKELYKRIKEFYNYFKTNEPIKQEKDKKPLNYGEHIINMLTYIESNIDKIKDKFRIYNRTDYENYETMRKIKNDIEKKHKIEKGEMLRLKEKEKFLKFKQEIENKTQKIIFIQRRKNDTNYHNNFEKIQNYSNINNLKEPDFEDFIDDKNEYVNFDYNI